VNSDEFQRLIDFAPNATMLALNRLIDFRIPTEIKSLTWSDVDQFVDQISKN